MAIVKQAFSEIQCRREFARADEALSRQHRDPALPQVARAGQAIENPPVSLEKMAAHDLGRRAIHYVPVIDVRGIGKIEAIDLDLSRGGGPVIGPHQE
jgi:hypothetical protein